MDLRSSFGSTLSTCKYDTKKKLQQPKLRRKTIENVHSIRNVFHIYLIVKKDGKQFILFTRIVINDCSLINREKIRLVIFSKTV